MTHQAGYEKSGPGCCERCGTASMEASEHVCNLPPERFGVPVDPEADERLRADLAAVKAAERRAWTVPPVHRPACPVDGHPCRSWTCLVDVCVDGQTAERQRISAEVDHDITREILEALCRRDGLSLTSDVVPDEPARNYELALRLGIGSVFGVS